jgi:hypothetical protein
MKPIYEMINALGATLFTFNSLFVMTAPAVCADEYCIAGAFTQLMAADGGIYETPIFVGNRTNNGLCQAA